MLLACEQEVADGITVAPQRFDHDFGLVRRHHSILGALEKDDRLRKPIGMIDRRTLAIARLFLRIGTDEPIEIARLEFVGVTGKRGRIAHAVVACPALKEVAEGKCREGGVAAGAAAADDDAL